MAVASSPLHNAAEGCAELSLFAHRRHVSSIVSGAAETQFCEKTARRAGRSAGADLVNASAAVAATRIQNEQHDCDREQDCDSHAYDHPAIMDQVLHHFS